MSSQISQTDPTSPLLRIPIRWFMVCCALVMLGLWLLQVHPYLSVANDAGRYMVLGESLARNGQLRLINDTRALPDTLYPPGFPALIAFWFLVTGRSPAGVVLPVKFTQLLLLFAVLPLMYRLLKRAGLSEGLIRAALVLTSVCPALLAYANEVMSEIPFLFCCLGAVAMAEADVRSGHEEKQARPWERAVSLLFAVGAFLVRTAGLGLLLAQIIWFWRRFGWRWGVAALAVALLVFGGWQVRNGRIIAHAPKDVHYATYADQFTLKDPMDPNAGRIPAHGLGLVKGLVRRAAFSLPLYIGYIPRAPLFTMSPNSPWLVGFYLIAIPFTLLAFLGFGLGWKRGLGFSGLFTAIFWLMAALWPWRDPRFIVPLIPYFVLYLFLGIAAASDWARQRLGERSSAVSILQGIAGTLFLVYCAHVHADSIHRERHPTMPGYALGRNKEEAGFYAACDWLKREGVAGAIVMGRPAYLLHLYSLHPTTQIEPNSHPRVQEMAYMRPKKVHYLLQDAWSWSHTNNYVVPYLQAYADRWKLVWQDPHGSGARIWERVAVPPAVVPSSPAVQH